MKIIKFILTVPLILLISLGIGCGSSSPPVDVNVNLEYKDCIPISDTGLCTCLEVKTTYNSASAIAALDTKKEISIARIGFAVSNLKLAGLTIENGEGEVVPTELESAKDKDPTIIETMKSETSINIKDALMVTSNFSDWPITPGESISPKIILHSFPEDDEDAIKKAKPIISAIYLEEGKSSYSVFDTKVISYAAMNNEPTVETRIVTIPCPPPPIVPVNKDLAIELDNFIAKAVSNRIHLTWNTGSEIKNAGFRCWRGIENSTGGYEPILLREFGHPEQVNPEPNENCSTKIQGQLNTDNSSQFPKLISTIGNSAESTCYSFTDTSILNDGTYYYLLEDIGDDGKSTFHCDHINAG